MKGLGLPPWTFACYSLVFLLMQQQPRLVKCSSHHGFNQIPLQDSPSLEFNNDTPLAQNNINADPPSSPGGNSDVVSFENKTFRGSALVKVVSIFTAACSVGYGLGLLIYAGVCTNQQFVFALAAATTLGVLDKKIFAAKNHFIGALAIMDSASPQALHDFEDRIEWTKKMVALGEKAKESGLLVDGYEAKKIQKLQQKQVRRMVEDLEKYKAANSPLSQIWAALNFAEILDICETFIVTALVAFFTLPFVLAGHNSIFLPAMFFMVLCLYKSLGRVLLFPARLADYPMSRTMLRMLIRDSDSNNNSAPVKPSTSAARRLSSGAFYFFPFLFTRAIPVKDVFETHLMLLGAEISIRGLTALAGEWRLELASKFRGPLGCLLFWVLAVVGQRQLIKVALARSFGRKVNVQGWWAQPLMMIEVFLDSILGLHSYHQ